VIAPGTPLNVVDSSAWLAYLADEPAAASFAATIEDTDRLVVPSVCILEVFKVLLRQRGEGDALQAAALMHQGRVIPLDAPLALSSAQLGLRHRLPLADSIVYATALAIDGIVWTHDDDFSELPGVKYLARTRTGN
jgi:predicted nucleic acid-binding protein